MNILISAGVAIVISALLVYDFLLFGLVIVAIGVGYAIEKLRG